MALIKERETSAGPVTGHRRAIRLVAAAVSAAVSVAYLILLFLVADAESVPGATDETTYGAYLFLAIPYLVGAVLLVLVDRRVLWAVGAAIQLAVIALFVTFGTGAFEYDALNDIPMELWAAAITAAQVVLLGLLGYLAVTRAGRDTASAPGSSG